MDSHGLLHKSPIFKSVFFFMLHTPPISEHNTVNHSLHFVDPVTGIHTQNIESYWAKHKYVLKKMKGCRREFLTQYLQEFMWRDKFEAG